LSDIFQSLVTHRRGTAQESALSIEILQEFLWQSRLGRKTGAGIYEYGGQLERVDLTETSRSLAQANHRTTPAEIEQRLFVIQAIEALHAIREGIIADPAMADLASVLGWSYPAGRGGVLGYLDFLGQEEFERVRRELEEKFGNRFAKPDA
jgi:3-hydroxyacyl-CoA dehydrogenase/enoyl-CoA hydratase/3-hydroxybutyryl-CoA epimerase